MTDSIRPAIRAHLADLMVHSDDIVVGDAADRFVDEHADEIAEHVGGMIRRAVSAELKALCAERAEDTGQLAFLPGIPAGIVVAPGVVRPRDRCRWADLQIGLQERVQNIAHAEKARDLYVQDMDRCRPYMEHAPDVVIGDITGALTADTG